uniref:Thiol-disulfide oxidoreductase DCC n=1 Tax=Ditylum brightwellii TaxID=49249 RepID=A0A7S4VJU3_9STRA|mmetsp:Transcript_62946/g.93508  ORF Transcript_62946/g.93508 Transcript_62946/m.93508 type:complete len:217 (+) Transcript_62946:88-738(+)
MNQLRKFLLSSTLLFHSTKHATTTAFVVKLPSTPLSTQRFTSSLLTEQVTTPQNIELDNPTTIQKRVFQNDNRPIILFDGVCNLCNNAVNIALDWDPSGKLRFAALQSNVGRALLQANGRQADDISSIVLVTNEGAYVKSDAILKITEALTPLSMLPLKPAAVLGRVLVPKFIRDVIYDGVADNRYDLMGKREECRYDVDGSLSERFVDDLLARKQ